MGLRRGDNLTQINARYCNDRPDCLRRIPAWLDGFALPVVKEKGYRPANLDKPPIRVLHAYLQPFGEGDYKRSCPVCGSVLLVARNQTTHVLLRRDRCALCAQLFIYMDETICGEPLEPLDAI
jgi:hypothetical protein